MRQYLGPLALGAGGVAILLSLGFWQLRRLDWKEEVLARIEARIAAVPVAVPAAPDPEADQYLAVTASGEIGAGEVHVLGGMKDVGPGFRIVAPFETGGRRLLLDRGFARDGTQDATHVLGQAEIAGNLIWPDDRTSSTPENDVAGNVWFARDLEQMAEVLGTEPVMIVAAVPTGEGIVPVPVSTAGIPNDHRQYAITWFSLAAVWAGMTVYLIRRISRRAKENSA